MHRLARRILFAWALLVAGSAPVAAQQRVQLDVSVPTASTTGVVTTSGLFGDSEMRELVRAGFPISLRFRLELWRSGGLFNDLEGTQEWELIVAYDPSRQRYGVARRPKHDLIASRIKERIGGDDKPSGLSQGQ